MRTVPDPRQGSAGLDSEDSEPAAVKPAICSGLQTAALQPDSDPSLSEPPDFNRLHVKHASAVWARPGGPVNQLSEPSPGSSFQIRRCFFCWQETLYEDLFSPTGSVQNRRIMKQNDPISRTMDQSAEQKPNKRLPVWPAAVHAGSPHAVPQRTRNKNPHRQPKDLRWAEGARSQLELSEMKKHELKYKR